MGRRTQHAARLGSGVTLDIPIPIQVVLIALLGGAVTALATWAIRRVRRADALCKAEDADIDARSALVGTVEAQAGLIHALEAQVKTLTDGAASAKLAFETELGRALKRIADLERIIYDFGTVKEIRANGAEARAKSQEARAVRHEAREVSQEARAKSAEPRGSA